LSFQFQRGLERERGSDKEREERENGEGIQQRVGGISKGGGGL